MPDDGSSHPLTQLHPTLPKSLNRRYVHGVLQRQTHPQKMHGFFSIPGTTNSHVHPEKKRERETIKGRRKKRVCSPPAALGKTHMGADRLTAYRLCCAALCLWLSLLCPWASALHPSPSGVLVPPSHGLSLSLSFHPPPPPMDPTPHSRQRLCPPPCTHAHTHIPIHMYAYVCVFPVHFLLLGFVCLRVSFRQ